jgi:hypothetical protein
MTLTRTWYLKLRSVMLLCQKYILKNVVYQMHVIRFTAVLEPHTENL